MIINLNEMSFKSQSRQDSRRGKIATLRFFFAGDAVTDLGTITQRPVQKTKEDLE